MKPRFSTILYLVAPCIALASLSLYLSRAKPVKSDVKANLTYGPFQAQVAEVETIPIKPIEVFKGYDRHFQVVFDTVGTRPKWLGVTSGTRSGSEIKDWTFWLENNGQRRPFKPSKSELWTSDYDKDKARYTNEFLLHCGDVPSNWALKARGTTCLSDDGKHLSASMPFETTLKKEGEVWKRPQISTDPGVSIRSIKITRPYPRRYNADITIFAPNMDNMRTGWSDMGGWLDGNWHTFIHHQVAPGEYHGYYTDIYHSFSSGSSIDGRSKQWQMCNFQWDAIEMNGEPRRDVIAVAHISQNDNWPLEIAFYAKRNGKVPLGEVEALTRPAQTKTAHLD